MNKVFDLLYLIQKDGDITQRVLSDKLMVSLGQINNLIKNATDAGYLIHDQSYVLTEKGKKLLKENRVDNAVIMAAGFGSRFVPMTYETPKGLLTVHGEVMIERQIEQLLAVGITDITIVIGYLKEKFEYLSDKYGVKLIYNPDYSIKNNISSLYYARNELKNTYILTSDIYMADNLYRQYECYSFYAAEFFEGKTSEWTLDVNKDNLILSVDAMGGSDKWAMFGPVFFKKDFSEKLITLIDHYYNEANCAQWYWEDVYYRHLDVLDMYIRKYPEGSILEFESLEELREYDKSYLINSQSEILDVISEVFQVSLSEIVNIQTLKEGMTNDSFLFEVRGEKYVFRNPGIGTEKLIKRNEEYNVYQVINDLKISDDVVYLNPERGYKITKYIPNARNIDPSNLDEVAEAMATLRILHESGLTVEHEFDIEERINYYHELCINEDAILFNDFYDVFEIARNIISFLNTLDREKIMAHVDSVPVNFLKHDGGITLLDWEYSGMADPLIDIAMYVVYQGLQDKEIETFLDIYLTREHTKQELLIVHAYIALAGFLWAMWTLYKQANGEDFGTYAMEQYQYARKYGRIVLKEVSNHA